MLLITPTQALINVEKLETKGGFTLLQQNDIQIIEGYDKVLHIIDTDMIKQTLAKIETDIDNVFSLPDDQTVINQLNLQIRKTSHNIETIIPHKQRRGLINLGGKILKWVFGTLDESDKQEIEEHLKTTDINNHNSIDTLNKQIKINNDLQENMQILTDRINENQKLTMSLLNNSIRINRDNLKQLHFIQVLTNINLLNDEIDKIQENIIFAKHNIMSRSILTPEEIDFYEVDISKLQEIKSSLLQMGNKLIFVIAIPKFYSELAKKCKLIPIPNENYEELAIEETDILLFKGKGYLDDGQYYFKNLKVTKDCIQSLVNNELGKCKKIKNIKFEIKELKQNLILIKNADNEKMRNTCNFLEYKLNRNYIINFNNCSIEIGNVKFQNLEKEFMQHVTLPNYLEIGNISEAVNMKKLHLKQIKNINEIKEIKDVTRHNKLTFYVSTSFIVITIAILILYIVKTKSSNVNVELVTKLENNKVQEDIELNEGGVIFPAASTFSLT